MEQAGPDETPVAEALWRTTDHIAAFMATGMIQLKGLAGPRTMFRLVELRADEIEEPALVRRQRVLAQLLSMLNEAKISGKGTSALAGDMHPGLCGKISHQVRVRLVAGMKRR